MTLDELRRARRRDPETSKAAAAAAHELANEHRLLILAALRDAGRELNATEIGAIVKLDSVQVCRRLGELEDDGLAEPTAITRPSDKGRASRCWRIVAPGGVGGPVGVDSATVRAPTAQGGGTG